MSKTSSLIINVLRWILGIVSIPLSILTFSWGDYVLSTLAFLCGTLVLPPVLPLLLGANSNKAKNGIANNKLEKNQQDNIEKSFLEIDIKNQSTLISEIDNFLNKYNNLNDKKRGMYGINLYEKALIYATYDYIINDIEEKNIQHIINQFKLNHSKIKAINNKIGNKVIEGFFHKKYQSGKILPSHINMMVELAIKLQLDYDIVQRIRIPIAINLFKEKLNNTVTTLSLSPQVETQMNEWIEDMSIDKNILFQHLTTIERRALTLSKEIWQINSGIILPIITSEIILKGDEQCYQVLSTTMLKKENVTANQPKQIKAIHTLNTPVFGLELGSSTVSYKETKETTIEKLYKGKVYITDRRIIFLQNENSLEINLENILSYEVNNNILKIIVSGIQYLFELLIEDAYRIEAMLSTLIYKMNNPNSNKALHAYREIEQNVSFI